MDLDEIGRILTADRQPYQEFSPEARAFMLGAVAAGATQGRVAAAVNTDRQRVVEQLHRFRIHKTVHDLPRPGRPRAVEGRLASHMYQLGRRYPRDTYRELQKKAASNLSRTTMRRFFRTLAMRKWRAAKRVKLSADDARKRLNFVTEALKRDNLRKLLLALFSDECTIQNVPGRPGQWVLRFASERYRKDLVNVQSHGRPRVSIMVWGMMWQRNGEGGLSPIVLCEGDPDSPSGGMTSRRYCEVLKEGLLPLYEAGDPFMQDNAPIYRGNTVKEFFESHGIWVIDWPPHSPDLNPIEHIWRALKDKIYEIEPEFGQLLDNEEDRQRALEVIRDAWSQVDLRLVTKLIKSLPKRLRAVRRAHGWYTKY
ncbi:hypothetical protein DL771_003891 [Monosporascus sp. 5C6A]|nr:hypothetical protein DL771_003891 [Monosporascus sp. 5C6A]